MSGLAMIRKMPACKTRDILVYETGRVKEKCHGICRTQVDYINKYSWLLWIAFNRGTSVCNCRDPGIGVCETSVRFWTNCFVVRSDIGMA